MGIFHIFRRSTVLTSWSEAWLEEQRCPAGNVDALFSLRFCDIFRNYRSLEGISINIEGT